MISKPWISVDPYISSERSPVKSPQMICWRISFRSFVSGSKFENLFKILIADRKDHSLSFNFRICSLVNSLTVRKYFSTVINSATVNAV